MVSKKSRQKSLPTDIKTDYLFDYFVNIDKFDKRKKKKWDAEKQELNESDEKKIREHEPKLDSRVFTEAQKTKTSASEEELPSTDSSAHKKNVTFNDEISESESSVSTSESQSEKKQYGHKISATHHTRKLHRKKRRMETPEERRARSRDAYANLKEMENKHGIVLTKKFTIDDDPNEMEEEYKMHKNQRDKQNQVKFYGNALLLIVSGVEFLNEKYNPFDFKLKDWSKQVAADKDDYTEVLEELYEKYKDRGGKMAPEIKLIFLIIMSGVTYHLSQTLFGSGGLNDTIEKNPNILNKLLGGLMKGGGIFGGGDDKQKTAIPNNKDILENIRKHKTNVNDNQTPMSPANQVSPSVSVTSPSVVNIDQRAIYEDQLRKQKQMYESQIMDLKNKSQSNKMISNKVQSPKTPQNQILSDARTRPRFQDNPLLNEMEHTPNIFENEMEAGNVDIGAVEINQALRSAGVKEKSNKYDELEETLDESLSDAKDIIEASSKKTNNIKSVSKKTKTDSVTTSKKPKNTSDIVSSARKKNNVIVL